MENLGLIFKLSIIFLVFLIALYFDLRYQRIPNLLCFVTLLLGFMVQYYFSGWAGLFNAFIGAGLALVILFPAFALKLLGAGDVKLMVAIGSFLTVQLLLWSLIYAIIAGAITSIFLALYKLGWQRFSDVLFHYLRCLYLRQFIRASDQTFLKLKVPYAPALAIGWLWACSQNSEVLALMYNLNTQVGG
ncbi:A24 family peptidase [Psychromonas hadalis]|uniref:A24 family peptidase n=1 Tax=Psychromonas hadalis TaxID=211669 RepID=UPI0003B73129|nr:A24 family peptidase [Psychromonas hadalis]